jgi:hypothetical protein
MTRLGPTEINRHRLRRSQVSNGITEGPVYQTLFHEDQSRLEIATRGTRDTDPERLLS